MIWNEQDLIRLAAFIDGEGCITINKRKSGNVYGLRFCLSVYIVNTDPRLPRWCQENFGGVLMKKRVEKYNPNNRNQLTWQLGGLEAEKVLLACLPYFLLKKEQAALAIEFQNVVPRNSKSSTFEELARKDEIRKKLSDLKWVKHELD